MVGVLSKRPFVCVFKSLVGIFRINSSTGWVQCLFLADANHVLGYFFFYHHNLHSQKAGGVHKGPRDMALGIEVRKWFLAFCFYKLCIPNNHLATQYLSLDCSICYPVAKSSSRLRFPWALVPSSFFFIPCFVACIQYWNQCKAFVLKFHHR